MAQIDPLKLEIQKLQERTWREFFLAGVPGTEGADRATASLGESPAMRARTLLDLADSLPTPAPVQVGGLQILVSPYVPTTDDRLVMDRRPLLRRIFTGQLCGVRAEEVHCDHFFLLEYDGRRMGLVSPDNAAVLRVFPEEVG